MANRRKHLVCPVALNGYHVWTMPETTHGLTSMFTECRACGAVLWTPKQVLISGGKRDTLHIPMAKKTYPQDTACYPEDADGYPQHIIDEVDDEHDDSDVSTLDI